MSIPAQAAVWDEARNTSRQRAPNPNALRDVLHACKVTRLTHPDLVRWIEDGHPNLTDSEHRERFGEPYRGPPRRSAASRR